MKRRPRVKDCQDLASFILSCSKCSKDLCSFLLLAVLEAIMLALPTKKVKGIYNWGSMMASLGLLWKHLSIIQIWPPSFLRSTKIKLCSKAMALRVLYTYMVAEFLHYFKTVYFQVMFLGYFTQMALSSFPNLSTTSTNILGVIIWRRFFER